MAEYMTVENGIVTGIFCGYDYTEPEYNEQGELIKPAEKIIPENSIDLPINHQVKIGDNINMYNADYTRKTGDDLLSVMTEEEKAEYHRAKRDELLNSVLWQVERHNQEKTLGIETTLTDDEYLALLNYIQELRNIPQQLGFPNSVTYPEKPE